jgi:hypothetical protein
MNVSPLPARGGIQFDRRNEGRALRVGAHPELGIVAISMWRNDSCVATHQLSISEVPELIRLLASALVEPAAQPEQATG